MLLLEFRLLDLFLDGANFRNFGKRHRVGVSLKGGSQVKGKGFTLFHGANPCDWELSGDGVNDTDQPVGNGGNNSLKNAILFPANQI